MQLEEIAKLETERRAALAEQNGTAYVRLCDELGLPPEDEFLYEQGSARFKTLSSPTTHPVFGFTKSSLGAFPYPVLQTIFFGMHVINLPPELMAKLNPAEILAKFYGAQKTKTTRGCATFTEAGFSALMRLFDRMAYYNPSFRAGAAKLPVHYSTKSGDQQKRLATVNDATKETVVRSFLAPPRQFYDPNCDGRNKRLYVTAVYDVLKTAYEQL